MYPVCDPNGVFFIAYRFKQNPKLIAAKSSKDCV